MRFDSVSEDEEEEADVVLMFSACERQKLDPLDFTVHMKTAFDEREKKKITALFF